MGACLDAHPSGNTSFMCARYTLDASSEEIAAFFSLEEEPPLPSRPFNLAPTDDVLIVRQDAEHRHADLVRWGLLPFWAKDKKLGIRGINARAETLWSKPMFRDAVKRRRCLVAATGFFEWREENGKQPVLFRPSEGPLLAFAGLWERWKDPQQGGAIVETAAIVTTDPNAMLAAFHNRMPVVLPQPMWELWLGDESSENVLSTFLHAPDDDFFTPIRVGRFVNNVRNHGPECVAPEAPGLFG